MIPRLENLLCSEASFGSNLTQVCSHGMYEELSLLSLFPLTSFRGSTHTLMHGLNNSPSVDHFGILCTPSHRNPCLLSLKLATENFKFDLHFPCTIRTTQFTLGKREQEFNCLASSTHSMRRNSTALYAGISWLKQRNNWNLFPHSLRFRTCHAITYAAYRRKHKKKQVCNSIISTTHRDQTQPWN
jgi:hypothetical protein